jgi:hypothetical protein
MAGPGETLGSPWPPLAIRLCSKARIEMFHLQQPIAQSLQTPEFDSIELILACRSEKLQPITKTGVFDFSFLLEYMGVWQGVAMDSIKYR